MNIQTKQKNYYTKLLKTEKTPKKKKGKYQQSCTRPEQKAQINLAPTLGKMAKKKIEKFYKINQKNTDNFSIRHKKKTKTKKILFNGNKGKLYNSSKDQNG